MLRRVASSASPDSRLRRAASSISEASMAWSVASSTRLSASAFLSLLVEVSCRVSGELLGVCCVLLDPERLRVGELGRRDVGASARCVRGSGVCGCGGGARCVRGSGVCGGGGHGGNVVEG
jgi:hypothetical protein